MLPSPAALGALYARHLAATAQAYQAIAPSLGQEAVARAVARALARRPRAALGCFASPTVATPIWCAPLAASLAGARGRIEGALAALGAHLALELAARRLLDWETIACAAPAILRSPSLGIALAPPAGELAFSDGAVAGAGGARFTVDGACDGFAVERAYRPLAGVTRLALTDGNPIASHEAHPEKSGNALDLGGRTVEEWTAALGRAIATACAHLPGLRDEMALLLHEIVPVGWHAERHLSASYREAIGTIYLTLHPDPIVMAEAVVHEFQHTKLNLLAYFDPLLENAFHPLFKSPVRPDPRPLWGILLAAHAFLPVAAMHRGLGRAKDDVDVKNHEAMEMLRANAKWTAQGKAIFDALDRLDRAHVGGRDLAALPSLAHTD